MRKSSTYLKNAWVKTASKYRIFQQITAHPPVWVELHTWCTWYKIARQCMLYRCIVTNCMKGSYECCMVCALMVSWLPHITFSRSIRTNIYNTTSWIQLLHGKYTCTQLFIHMYAPNGWNQRAKYLYNILY